MSLSAFEASEFSCLFEGDSLDLVTSGIADGSIVVADIAVDACFGRLSHLPATSRLSWHEIPHLGLGLPADGQGTALLCKLEMLDSIGNYFGLRDQRGLLFEDLFADCVLELAFADFVRLRPDFFESAGHKYFLDVSGDWLVNFTMEEQLYFSDRIAQIG